MVAAGNSLANSRGDRPTWVHPSPRVSESPMGEWVWGSSGWWMSGRGPPELDWEKRGGDPRRGQTGEKPEKPSGCSFGSLDSSGPLWPLRGDAIVFLGVVVVLRVLCSWRVGWIEVSREVYIVSVVYSNAI